MLAANNDVLPSALPGNLQVRDFHSHSDSESFRDSNIEGVDSGMAVPKVKEFRGFYRSPRLHGD
jgi:hypothetical protein